MEKDGSNTHLNEMKARLRSGSSVVSNLFLILAGGCFGFELSKSLNTFDTQNDTILLAGILLLSFSGAIKLANLSKPQ
jgi:hypothetical protein